MKPTLQQRAAFLLVEAEVRYPEDAGVNGQQDFEGVQMPFMENKVWKPVIDLNTGTIVGWPEGTSAEIHYKVCDQGVYHLADADKKPIAKYKSDYVPDEFLCHGDTGYDDYIIMAVDASGRILEWRKPEVDPEMWEEVSE